MVFNKNNIGNPVINEVEEGKQIMYERKDFQCKDNWHNIM